MEFGSNGAIPHIGTIYQGLGIREPQACKRLFVRRNCAGILESQRWFSDMLPVVVYTRFDGHNASIAFDLLGIASNETLFLDYSRRIVAYRLESAH
jgi:hypothetical protein